MRTSTFWIDTAERAIKTVAQSLIATLAVGIPLWEIDWLDSLGVALTAGLISLLTSIASTATGSAESASLVDYTGQHRAGE